MTLVTLSLLMRILGFILFLVGWWPSIREMFAENRMLGYLGFMAPVVTLIFSLIHWDDLKVPFCIQLSGAGLLAGGILLDPAA